MIRIVGGKYKRTPLKTLAGEEITRPTRDMVREALFSTICIDPDTRFLDLFAGSGAVGLEALSRGAEDAVFNDCSREAIRIIFANLEKVRENRRVYCLDYQECLEKLKGECFDFIYCDPPYVFTDYEELFRKVEETKVLKEGGTVILEVRKDSDPAPSYADLVSYKERRYGISKLLYYRKEKQS